MGRVRRYKKIKAADPFAKRQKAEVDTIHDEPPDEFYDKKVKREKKLQEKFSDPDFDVIKEGIRSTKESLSSKNTTKSKQVEGKRDDESMKKFKQRIRQETRITLCDELQKLSKTSQKRKERLKDRKKKRKLSKMKDSFQEEIINFNVEDDNAEIEFPAKIQKLRPSDLGGSSSFSGVEHIKFGEVADRPPDIKKFNIKTKNHKIEQHNETESNIITKDIKKNDRQSIFSPSLKSGLIHAGSTSKPTANEMEALRQRVQEAYSKVREKRRENNTNNFLSNFIV